MSSTEVKIGEVARRTGLSVRTLRYYEEIGLLPPTERLSGGHRVYDRADLERLYRIGLLRQLGTPLAAIARALDGPQDGLRAAVDRHLATVDVRLAAMGRLRERVSAVSRTLHEGGELGPVQVLDLLDALSVMDHGLTQRITLLVYEDIETVHDHLVTVFGFGPGELTRDTDGTVVHGELHIGDGIVWLHPEQPAFGLASPRTLGASTHGMAVLVDDVDRHYGRSLAAGADIVTEPRDQPYGFREYDARDIEGGLWSFMAPLSANGATEGETDG
jgi:DNA-binding transcriptional MerR regulator